MNTLNQIGTSIINELNQFNNHELLERVKDRVKFLTALIVKRNVDKYGIGDELLIPLRFELVKINLPTLCKSLYNKTSCFIYETKYNVPTPIRTNGKPLFNYIGSSDGIRPFYFTKEAYIPPLKLDPINSRQIFVSWVNNKLRVYGNNHITILQANMIVTDLDGYVSMCGDCHDDDDVFLAPHDIIDSIIRTIVEEYRKASNVSSTYEIKVDANDKQTVE